MAQHLFALHGVDQVDARRATVAVTGHVCAMQS
jgi:hypothetical protein